MSCMKVLKYTIHGLSAGMTWNETNEETVKRIADGGIYTIEDDGVPEEEIGGETIASRVSNLETKTDDLTEALDMILNEVVE